MPDEKGVVNADSVEIVPASDANLSSVKALFQEYWNSFSFTPCFQNFDAELATLPGRYQPPQGRLALALVGGEPGGCIALRPVDATRCEAKRLYVRPQFRGAGIGKALLEWVIAEARAAGYTEMVGDTLPAMERAIAMYERMGFERTGAYEMEATQGTIYIRLRL